MIGCRASVSILLLCATLTGCRNEGSNIKAIIGATLKQGSTSVADCVVIIDGARIRAIGPRPAIPIPQNSERLDASGKTISPTGGESTLAPGKPASLMLLGTDGKVERVMAEGRWVSARQQSRP